MLFTILCCISTGLCVYCILRRVNQRTVEIAVRLAVRDAEKEFEAEKMSLMAQIEARLGAKEGELKKARQLVQLHEAVPASATPAKPRTPPPSAPAAKPAPKKLREDALHVFEMSRPFTDTSYDALLASSNIVKIETSGL